MNYAHPGYFRTCPENLPPLPLGEVAGGEGGRKLDKMGPHLAANTFYADLLSPAPWLSLL